MLYIAGPQAHNPVFIGRYTMAAYIIAQIEVTDPDRFGEYQTLAPKVVEKHGGRFLARGGATALLEGNWDPPRVVILEFPSLEQARRFYDSPEYQQAKQVRSGVAKFNMLAVEGV